MTVIGGNYSARRGGVKRHFTREKQAVVRSTGAKRRRIPRTAAPLIANYPPSGFFKQHFGFSVAKIEFCLVRLFTRFGYNKKK
ncbi:MAG: hypothetical protein EYC68_05950 [Chloroflexota bacterium]|nr:MAG: hypothetical protein EYC68_05950 [Chloroflexota bacterium]